METQQELVDVIIVGTGLGGLAAAKTYIELSPQTDLILIEKVRQSLPKLALDCHN